MKTLPVSAIIPNYNGGHYLKELLDSIYAQTVLFEQVIVVDDASTDHSVSFIIDNYPKVVILQNIENKGFIYSVNHGIRFSQSKYVCLLNNDLYLSNDWLEKAMEPFNLDDSVAAVATNLLIADSPSLIDAQGDDYFITGAAVKHNNLKKNLTTDLQTRRVFSACGAAVVYLNDVLRNIGLYDPYFSAYYGDVDIAFRINLHGYKILYTPRAVSYHRVSATYGRKPKTTLFNSHRNAEIVFWANMPAFLLCKYALLRVVFVLLEAIVKLKNGEIFIYIQSKIAFLAAIPYVIRKRIVAQKLRQCSIKHIDDCLRRDWINYFIVNKFR